MVQNTFVKINIERKENQRKRTLTRAVIVDPFAQLLSTVTLFQMTQGLEGEVLRAADGLQWRLLCADWTMTSATAEWMAKLP